MAEIIWTDKAKQQLRSAVNYVASSSSIYYANIVLNGILEQIEVLNIFPKAGKTEPALLDKKFEYRFLIRWSYKIIYRTSVNNEKVCIVRIFHTSQNPNKLI